MRFITTRLDRTLLAALFGAVLAAGVGWLICHSRLERPLERQSYNLLHVAGGDVRVDEAAIVYMDEVSFKELHQPLNAPWDRTLHARLVERLTSAGAKAIVFDIVFTDPMTNDPAADQRFAAAMKASGRVVLAADNVEIGPKQKQIYRPFDLFYDSTAGVGSVEMLQETDMAIRRHTPEEQIPSLSWAAAEFLKAPITQDESQRQAQRWVRYYGQPGWLPAVSYHQALDPTKVGDSFFSNRTVFVGARIVTKMAAFRKDEYATPYSFWLSRTHGNALQGFFAAGVEVQATMFLNLFRGDWLTRWSRSSEQLLIYAIGLLFGFGLVRLRPWLATVCASLGLAVVAGTSYFAFRERLVWFPWLIPVVQIVTAWAWSILYNLFQYYAQKRLMEHTLSLYLSPKLVGKFARDPKLLKPGAEKQVITILFTDIENFTPMAQDMDSNELAEFMNRYFQKIVGSCIHPADGTVVKYIGDAVFSFWNAPEAQPDHAFRACDAALRMRDLEAVTLRGQPVRTRVGIHTGEANVGNFGSVQRVDYTALGENVNLASRLEGLNKFVGTDCLISAETRTAVGDRLVMRRVGLFTLKGFSKSVEVFEIVDRPEVAEKSKAWREAFDQALRNYEEGNFEFATMGFRGVLDLKPDDGPTKFYLERLDDVSKQPVEGDWTGITMLREK